MRTEGVLDRVYMMDGNMIVSFKVRGITASDLESITDKELTIEASKKKKRRSLDANAYFWTLCHKIAEVIGSDKDSVYLLQLGKYGQFVDMDVLTEAVPILKQTHRYVEVLGECDDRSMVRCYFGSSSYDSQQMSNLIRGTVDDASALGIQTMTPDQINEIVSLWKGGGYDY